MIFAMVQVVLSSIAGFAIFRLWQRITASGRTVFWLVTTGLLVRAVGGVVAFWMSYLGLPVGRSLQIGRGLWVFAIDATTYVQFALFYAGRGLLAILLIDKSLPAPFFIQMLAGAMLCFGSVISVAILLNLAAYLGCCAIVLSFGDATRRPAVFAIAVLSLSPSAIVWSLQPLKDVTFLFLVMAFFGAARVWQQLWGSETSRHRVVQGVVWSAVMAGLLYGISGVRWYFGAVILIAAVPFAMMTIAKAHARIAAAAVSLLLLTMSWTAFLASAWPYLPPAIQKAMRARDVQEQAGVPRMVMTAMRESRRGFDRAGGTTIIGAGSAIRQIDAAFAGGAGAPSAPLARPRIATSLNEKKPATPASNVAKHAEQRMAEKKKHSAAAPTPPTQSSPAQAPAVVAGAGPPPARGQVQLPPPRKVARQLRPTAVTLPVSPIARILAGTAAIVLPHSLGQRFGIVDVRGGRGMWLFVEIDTIVFDIVLAFTLFSIAVAVRCRTLGAPVFWLMLFVTGAVGVALVYTVSNFGTLFRHRDMLLVGLVLLPIAAAGPVTNKDDNGERTSGWPSGHAAPLAASQLAQTEPSPIRGSGRGRVSGDQVEIALLFRQNAAP